MITACPKCKTRYQLDVARIAPGGSRLRCKRCETVFRVMPPTAEQAPSVLASSEAVTPPAPQPRVEEMVKVSSPATQTQRTVAAAASSVRASAETLVLVADPDVESGKRLAESLASWGFSTLLTHDGVDAILETQRKQPSVLIMNSMLPKMYGFQVCELIKRNESLHSILVVLVGEVHDPSRYHRAPDELYGADAYIEQPSLPDGLIPLLEKFQLLERAPSPAAPPIGAAPTSSELQQPPQPVVTDSVSTPRASSHAFQVRPASAPVVEPSVDSQAPPLTKTPVEDDSTKAEWANAERLARIIISDVVLYNEERFAEAVSKGDVVKMMEPDLAEGRNLFSARIDSQVRAERDFLTEELLRVAEQRR